MAATPAITIRATSPADLPMVTALLSERDGVALDPGHVASALYGLEPSCLAGWIALVDGEPAGLTTLYLREQRFGKETVRAGYWAHLFVREQFRKLMVYPQLVLAMMRGTRTQGIEAIFTGTRRAHVAEGHVKLGFAKVGELGVLFKPLRPFRLLARYKRWPGLVQSLAAVGDGLYRGYLGMGWKKPPAGVTFRPGVPADLGAVVDLLNGSSQGRSGQVWTVGGMQRRLRPALDGRGYQVIVAERVGHIIGAGVYRIAIRERVEAGIVMDLVTAPGEDAAMPALLGRVERELLSLGADTTLYLDGLGADLSGLLRRTGHRVSKDTYQMLVWPKTLVPPGSPAADLALWRFSLLDHDAF